MQAVSSLFTSIFSSVSIAFCGHLGKTELASIGLAMTVFNVAGVFVMSGLLTACDTIFTQVSSIVRMNNLSILPVISIPNNICDNKRLSTLVYFLVCGYNALPI